MDRTDSPDGQEPRIRLANRLHSVAVHLLRRVRQEDPESGLTAARLSALSVVVFAGPIRPSELAKAEQVRPPTITRLVGALEAADLVRRRPDPRDGRAHLIEATERGVELLEEGRRRRVERLARDLQTLDEGALASLREAVTVLEGLTLPDERSGVGETGGPAK